VLVRGINQDITERRRSEERQMLLAREVDHRAKNALAVVQAIVGLTRDRDPEAFRTAVIGRIAAMARAHNLLAREGWDRAEMAELVAAELAPHRAESGPDRITLEGPNLALAAGAAQPLAMALHELATNAAKYGALSVPEGRLAVCWRPLREGRPRAALDRARRPGARRPAIASGLRLLGGAQHGGAPARRHLGLRLAARGFGGDDPPSRPAGAARLTRDPPATTAPPGG
jgi:two-component sensor histidine kinase